jgi:hypothetical protein
MWSKLAKGTLLSVSFTVCTSMNVVILRAHFSLLLLASLFGHDIHTSTYIDRVGRNRIYTLDPYIYMPRVGQNRICAPYLTVYLVISLPKVPYIHRIYMVLANPIYAVYSPEPYIYAVSDRIIGDFPAINNEYAPYIS